jgi:hypothetical protein
MQTMEVRVLPPEFLNDDPEYERQYGGLLSREVRVRAPPGQLSSRPLDRGA